MMQNAYILLGEDKYKDWLLDYVGNWMERAAAAGGIRVRSHCRFALPFIHNIPYSLMYSVPLFSKRQCHQTLGGMLPDNISLNGIVGENMDGKW